MVAGGLDVGASGGSDERCERRRASISALSPPCGSPRSRQSAIMVDFKATSRSVERRRSVGDAIVIFSRESLMRLYEGKVVIPLTRQGRDAVNELVALASQVKAPRVASVCRPHCAAHRLPRINHN